MSTTENNPEIEEYLNQLTKDEKIIYEIAKKNLKTSFDITKSIGYLKFIANKNIKIKNDI